MRSLNQSGFRAYSTADIEDRLRAIALATLMCPGEQPQEEYRKGFLIAIAAVAVAFGVQPDRIRDLLKEFGA